MRHFILIFLLSAISCTQPGQNNDTWFAFYNKDSSLIGFKDRNGLVKIEPKFQLFSIAKKFDDIIVAIEENKGKWESYYLTRSGRIMGRDSLFMFDNTPDCESEGFIRFSGKKTGKVGMLNSNGDVVIPAEYNWLGRVTNGMVIGLKGAEKEYWDKDEHSGCEHFNWKGGTTVLLDTMNNVLINNFTFDKLNLFSLEKTKQPHPDTTRRSFLATDGNYLSFIDFEKEFRHWLTNELLLNLTKEKLINASYDSITWESNKYWETSSRQVFIDNNFEVLKTGLQEIQNTGCDYFISADGLNQYMYEEAEFEKYYNNCGEAKEWIYPVMSIIISHKDKEDLLQDQYEFLRTDDGYKLIEVTMRSKKIK